MKKVLIIGASSGIGASLAELFANRSYLVGIAARREDLLNEISSRFPENIISKSIDVTTENAVDELNDVAKKMAGIDILIISAGTGDFNPELKFPIEMKAIELNVKAYTALVDWGYNYFKSKGKGIMVNISSIAGLRGSGLAPAYNASKAYQINYLEGLRQKATKEKLPLTLIDVRPGFVDTPMAKGEGLFWVAPLEKAANQIYRAIKAKKQVVYVTKRWLVIAIVLKILPSWIYKRF